MNVLMDKELNMFYKTESLNEKLKAAKEYLGESYILHPAYDSKKNPQHLKKSVDYLAGGK